MTKWTTSALTAVLALLAAAGTSRAQDSYEQVKKRILDKLEAEIKAFYDRLESELRQTIREEVAKLKPASGATPPKAAGGEPEPAPPKSEPPKVERKPGYLGILASRDFTDEDRKALELGAGEGLLVEGVREGSPAETAGLAAGMVVVKINGEKVTEEGMRDLMAKFFAGDKIQVTVLQDGKTSEIPVTLGER